MASSSKLVVITGVTRGLGRALFERFVDQGHRVAGCGRDEQQLAQLREELGDWIHVQPVDVCDSAQVESWAQKVLDELGAPDLLINNAARMNDPAPLWRVPAEEFDRLLAVNVGGTANVVRAFVPAMIERGRGVVVNLSSGWGRSTAPQVGPYCATKYAIEGFTGSLAQELPAGMAAVSLNPGVIDTDMLRQCWDEAASAYEGARSWAERALPFLLGLSGSDNGGVLSVP